MMIDILTHNATWILQSVLILLLVAVVHRFEVRVMRRFMARRSASKGLWKNAFAMAVHRPLGFWFWGMGLCFVLNVAWFHLSSDDRLYLNWVEHFQALLSILLIVWTTLRFIGQVEHAVIRKAAHTTGMNMNTATTIARLMRILVAVAGILIVFQTLGYPISGLLALGGLGTVVVGLAAKDLLANFFGGLMIYLDRPFTVGDWIFSKEKDIDGIVEHIGWRLTQIRTFEKRPLYVPNSIFAQILLENPSRMTHRRIKESFRISYEYAEKLPTILAEIRAMLKKHPDLDSSCLCTVNLVKISETAFECLIQAYTPQTALESYLLVQEDILLSVFRIIDRLGAKIPAGASVIRIPDGLVVKQEI